MAVPFIFVVRYQWELKYDQCFQILVFTDACFLRALNSSKVSLAMVGLLVVDECHRAVGDSPCTQIFKSHFTKHKVISCSLYRLLVTKQGVRNWTAGI